MGEPQGHGLVNGEDVQFEYKETHTAHSNGGGSTSGKTRGKNKKKKGTKQGKVHVTDVQLENPDEDYPESRVLKQDVDGSLLIQKMEPVKTKKKQNKNDTSAQNDDLLPTDPEELNRQLSEYWNQLTVDEKKELLNKEREAVFKIMRDKQKITCDCTVCGRKRSIIEQELKKLYDTYYQGIENNEMMLSELFNFSEESPLAQREVSSEHSSSSHSYNQMQQQEQLQQQQQQTLQQQQQQRQQSPSKQDSSNTAKKGIMTIAEDLLQNDGKKFLEMMERIAETQIKRHTELLRNTQKEEEDEEEYYSDDNVNETYLEDSQHFGQAHDMSLNSSLRPSSYKIPPLEDIELPEDPVSYYWSKSDEEMYNSEDDPDYDPDEDPDLDVEMDDDEMMPDDFGLSILTEFHREMLDLLEEQQDMLIRDGLHLKNNVHDQKILEMHIVKQKLLQRQLKQEHEKLKQFKDQQQNAAIALSNQLAQLQEDVKDLDFDDEEDDDDEYLDEDEEDSAEEDEDDEEEDNDEEEDDDLGENDPIDEEQHLAEGRAMLQLCATKMLKQSLLRSYKDTLIKKRADNLLEELLEDEEQQRRKEEKKHRERERKKEKKKLLKQQKEEERLKKLAEEERIAREKREEMIRKTEEGRRRKQEEERKKREEQRRKEEELEKQRKAKEEKKRLKEEMKKREEEEKLKEEQRLKKEEDAKRRQQEVALNRESEIESQRVAQFDPELLKHEQEAKSIEALRSRDGSLKSESINMNMDIPSTRSNSNLSATASSMVTSDFHPLPPISNTLFDSVVQQTPFMASPMMESPQPTQYNPLQHNIFGSPWQRQGSNVQLSTQSLESPLRGMSQSQQGMSHQPPHVQPQPTSSQPDFNTLAGAFNSSSIGGSTNGLNNSFMPKDTLWGNNVSNTNLATANAWSIPPSKENDWASTPLMSQNGVSNSALQQVPQISQIQQVQSISEMSPIPQARHTSQVPQVQHIPQISPLGFPAQPALGTNDTFGYQQHSQLSAQSQPQNASDDIQRMIRGCLQSIYAAYQGLPKSQDGYVGFEQLFTTTKKISPTEMNIELFTALFEEPSDEFSLEAHYYDGSKRIQFARVVPKRSFSTPTATKTTNPMDRGEPRMNSFSDLSNNGFGGIGVNNGFDRRSTSSASGQAHSIW